jgi:hypothetical protein
MADSKNPQKKSAKDRKADRHVSSRLFRVDEDVYAAVAAIAKKGGRAAKKEAEAALRHWATLTAEERRKAAGWE